VTPLVLGALAVALAGPAPALLARMPELRRTPRAAMVLWQSVALAAVLAALGAGLSLTTDHAWRRAPDPVSYAVAGAALLVTALVAGRLLLSGHLVGTELRALRREHRAQVDLLARRDARRGDGVRVLEHDVPVAYCLPGVNAARVVVSAGALGRLDDGEMRAVLAHERAHLRARHDLVLEAFTVLHRAFPRWVSSRAALAEVRLLVELLADRAAARHHGRRPLARALVALAEGRAPEVGRGVALGTGTAGPDLLTRITLLGDDAQHRLQGTLLVALVGAVLLLPTTFVVVPWLRDL
jgi:Zn-dependent protease with chaperone function